MPRVLVVDDEETVREALCEAIAEAGIDARGASDGETAMQYARQDIYEVCITDIRMPGMDGIELLQKLAHLSPDTRVIVITAYGELETAIEALRAGATDYVLKPFVFDAIINKVHQLIEHRALSFEVQNLRRVVQRANKGSGMVGSSPAMREIRRLISKVVMTRSPVLVTGESGTGKELIARAIHDTGENGESHPFVPINCAAIPETLLESELFGYTKGAFSGAVANKDGLLKAAGEGTVFLDEIADMPTVLQAKLLRALQSRQIQPLGSVQQIPIQARIIAALNKDLKEELDSGRLRRDLYYRIAVVEIEVPPLRCRREDIPPMIEHFIRKYNTELNRHFAGVSEEALERLVGYHWQGNVRELENVIERAMIVSDSDVIELCDLPESIQGAAPVSPNTFLDLRRASRQFELTHIQRVLRRCRGDKRQAAKLLGLSLSSLYRKLETVAEKG